MVMAYPTRRSLRMAGQEDPEHGRSPPRNGANGNGKMLPRRRDSGEETASEDEVMGPRRSKRIHLSNYRPIDKGILVAQAIPLTGMDMYSRVKSGARQHYNDDGLRVRQPRNSTAGNEMDNGTDHGEEDSDHDEHEDSEDRSRGYNLRRHRAQPQFFVIERKESRRKSQIESHHERRHHSHRRDRHHRRHSRRAAHSPRSYSTTPSSSDNEMDHRKKRDDGDPDARFERRRVRSMACARREVLPVNFTNADLELLGLKDRIRAGGNVADIDPMYIDKTTTFEHVGGLDSHIRQLKEMIVFPLLYPEMFSQFGITPPRGVLFYGPPGTGKTLLARALANECSKAGGKRVAFFMRRGADCLSKWVGESERQLRLLFDQAYQLRPSIIFFDEVDGLAPIRSSRQDQIHSSIVSTLLALMDGLDSRQEVVVIGATNRIDSIDPALRRPGRFDREFPFHLPNKSARRDIVQIHTKSWNPPLWPAMIESLAEQTVGFSGADLRGLCTEAVLNAVRRKYPQIYSTQERIGIDTHQLRPTAIDFQVALSNMTPTAARARQPLAWPLSDAIRPLLNNQLETFLLQLTKVFSHFQPHFDKQQVTFGTKQDEKQTSAIVSKSAIFRPRLLLSGRPSQGHISHLAPAVLHNLEDFRIHPLSIASVFGGGDFQSPEDAIHKIVTEAARTAPSVLYCPDLDQLLQIASSTLRIVIQLAIEGIKPDLPVLLLATCRQPSQKVFSHSHMIRDMFRNQVGQIYDMRDPDQNERRQFFAPLFTLKSPESCVAVCESTMSSTNGSLSPSEMPTVMQIPTQQVHMTEAEKASLFLKEEVILREMRVFLRDVLNRLLRDRRFGVFSRPVDRDDAPDYYEIIESPMDLSLMMSKIDRHEYQSVGDFVTDIDLIAKNALEYNPETDNNSRQVRHRACALRDACATFIDSELDPDFERQCLSIKQSRKVRKIDAKKTAPAFIYTPNTEQRPVSAQSMEPHPASATVSTIEQPKHSDYL